MKASPSSLADLEAVLAEVPLFSGLNGEDLAALSSLAERQDLRSGARLYKEGDPSTHCYVVLRGRLRETSDGELLGYIGRLEPVGAIGIQMGEPRNSTIRAVRDSILLRSDGQDFARDLHATFTVAKAPPGYGPIDHDWMFDDPELFAAHLEDLGLQVLSKSAA